MRRLCIDFRRVLSQECHFAETTAVSGKFMVDKPPCVLVVDDDPRMHRLLGRYLRAEGYRVELAADIDTARVLLQAQQPNLVLLDLRLSGENGLELAKEIRSRSSLPIIVLSGKTDTVDKVVALELGADDYVTKPFDPRELLARVHSVLRRADSRPEPAVSPEQHTCTFLGWELDLVGYELTSPNRRTVALTNNEFQLLAALVKSRNRVMSRDEILDAVNGRDWMPSDRSVDVLVGKLRRKIEKDPTRPEIVRTVRNVGYKFAARVEFS